MTRRRRLVCVASLPRYNTPCTITFKFTLLAAAEDFFHYLFGHYRRVVRIILLSITHTLSLLLYTRGCFSQNVRVVPPTCMLLLGVGRSSGRRASSLREGTGAQEQARRDSRFGK